MSQAPPMPGRLWYGIAGLVGVAGVAGFVIFLWTSIAGFGEEMQQMKAPGSAEFSFQEPGVYTVFHEYESVFEGAYFSSPNAVSGLRLTVQPGDGKPIALRASGVNASYNAGGRSGTAIFEFDIPRPGAYRVEARYSDGTDRPVIILAIGHDFTGDLLRLILTGMAIMFGGLGGAGAITIITYLKRERALSAREETS